MGGYRLLFGVAQTNLVIKKVIKVNVGILISHNFYCTKTNIVSTIRKAVTIFY